MSVISKKICIIGEPEVGKNSLMLHSADEQFSDAYLETVGVKIFRKNIEFQGSALPHKLNLQLLIWNITGNDKFKAIAPTYWRGSCGAVVVADVSRPETIQRLPEYVELFLSINPEAFIIIALNKADLIEQEKLEKLTQLINLQQISGIYPTSAKTGLYIDEIFLQIAYKIIESWDASSSLQIPPEPEDTIDLTIGETERLGDREKTEEIL